MIMFDGKVVGGEKVGAWIGDLRANECGERNRKIGFQKPEMTHALSLSLHWVND
jgi:hypothetical protein